MIIKPQLHSLIFIAGPSGAGKSTLAKIIKGRLDEQLQVEGYHPNVQIVSSDETRRELLSYQYGRHDPVMLHVSRQAFRLMEEKVEKLMQWPVSAQFIILDATNIMAANREPFLKLSKKYHYAAEIIALDFKSGEEYEKFLPDDFSKKILYRGIRNMREKFYPNLNKKEYSMIHKVRTKDFSDIRTEIQRLDLWKKTFLPEKTADTYILADIHGCLTEFKEALAELGYGVSDGKLIVPERKENDVIVLLGDLIDKGPENAATIDFVHANLDKFTIVLGNHENFIARWFEGKVKEGFVPQDVLEKFFTCVAELRDDPDRQRKFYDIVDAGLPFVRSKYIFAHHAPCESKYFGKVDNVSLKAQRNFRIPRADVTEGDTPDHVVAAQKKAWEEGLRFWEEQAVTNFPWHFVGHLPLLKASRIKNQFMIDGGLPNGGTLIVVKIKYGARPTLTHIPKMTPTRYKDRLFPVFDQDPRHRIEVTDLDDDGLRRLRFAVENKVNFISGTMSPVDKQGDDLESIEQGFEYYKKAGVEKVILQQKYMGSRCNLYLNPDPEKCYATSRGGFSIRNIDLKNVYEDQLKVLGPVMAERKLEWMVIDGELLPWHVLGAGLIEGTFKAIEYAIESELKFLKETRFEEVLKTAMTELEATDFAADKSAMKKAELADKYGQHKYGTYKALLDYKHVSLEELEPAIETYKKQIELYGQPGVTTFKGFAVLKIIYTSGEERTCFEDSNLDTYKLTGNTDPCLLIDLSDEKDLVGARSFYQKAAESGLEGIVMKPEQVYLPKVAPYLKIRNPAYRTIIYGYDYQTSAKYERLLKQKSIWKKVRTSIAEFEIGKGLLEIPRSEINEDNPKYARLIAQMITQEKLEKGIDPRL
jgi:predicted kinase